MAIAFKLNSHLGSSLLLNLSSLRCHALISVQTGCSLVAFQNICPVPLGAFQLCFSREIAAGCLLIISPWERGSLQETIKWFQNVIGLFFFSAFQLQAATTLRDLRDRQHPEPSCDHAMPLFLKDEVSLRSAAQGLSGPIALQPSLLGMA